MQGNRAHIIKGKSLTYIYRFSRLDFFHKCINSLITVCRNSCFKSRIILISGKIYIYHSTGRTFSVICVVIVDEKAGLTAKVCGNYISGIVDRETLVGKINGSIRCGRRLDHRISVPAAIFKFALSGVTKV